MAVDLWVRTVMKQIQLLPAERTCSQLQSAEPLWEAFCNLSVSRFISLRGRFLTSARGDRGGMKMPGKEKWNMKLDDWAVIGLKRRTISPHVDEMKQNMTIIPCFHLWFCCFQYFFDTSSCLHLSPWFSPSGLFQVVCVWKNAKTKNRGKTADSRGRIKGKKGPLRRCSQKYLTSLSPLFSICDNTSLIVFLYSFLPSSCKNHSF